MAKTGTWRKTQICCGFGSKQGPHVLPAPSSAAALLSSAFEPPHCLRASREPLKNHVSLGKWKNTTLQSWKCQSVGAGRRAEQHVASANGRKSDTGIQRRSSGSGRELALVVRWEKCSWIPFIARLLRQHRQIVPHLQCSSFPSRSNWDCFFPGT